MKGKTHKTREVFKIKNHLYKVAPNILDIDIKIKRSNDGKIKSQIFVHMPKKKKIVSSKVDNSLTYSLEKAHKAIVKQITKLNKPKIKRQTIRKIDFEMAA